MSRINALRKDAGLEVEDRIALYVQASGERLAAAMSKHAELLRSETMATQLVLGSPAPSTFAQATHDLGAEGSVTLALQKT